MEELKSLLPEYCKRLQKKGVTREALHREYLSSHPDGYGRTRFYILIQQHIACSRPIMLLKHKAGDKVFIDFAGDNSPSSTLIREKSSLSRYLSPFFPAAS